MSGYVVVNMRANYQVTQHVTLFARVDNVFNAHYATFGTFGQADEVLGDSLDNPRFLSPAAPRAGFFGARVHF